MTHVPSTELAAAIERVYAVFGKYARPAQLNLCEQCIVKEADKGLHELPLREIPGWMLLNYVEAEHGYSEGGIPAYKHFLPRICEVIATDAIPPGWSQEEDRAFSFLGPSDWQTRWPTDEARTLARYFDCLLRDALAAPIEAGKNGKPRLPARDLAWWFEVAGRGAAALPAFEAALVSPGRMIDLHIANFVNGFAYESITRWQHNGKARGAPFDAAAAVRAVDDKLAVPYASAQYDQEYAAWNRLADPAVHARIEAAFWREQEAPFAEDLSIAEKILAALIRARAKPALR